MVALAAGDGFTARDEAVGESLDSGLRSQFRPLSVAQRPYPQGVRYLSLNAILFPKHNPPHAEIQDDKL